MITIFIRDVRLGCEGSEVATDFNYAALVTNIKHLETTLYVHILVFMCIQNIKFYGL